MDNYPLFNIDGFQVMRVLSIDGATGTVYLAITPDGIPCALKILVKNLQNRAYAKLHKNMASEIEALEALHHPHIMRILGGKLDVTWEINGRTFQGDYIASELLAAGELFDYISNPQGPVSERIAKQLFKQMLYGLVYMHERGIVNRDLKLENMFVGDDYKIRIGDFGFAKPVEGTNQDGKLVTALGTPGYMAPEILEGRPYSGVAVDIFALGVVLFSMVTGSAPFQGLSAIPEGTTLVQVDKLYQLFMTGKDRFFGRFTDITISDEFKSLIGAMLHPDPKMRPTYQDITMHSWYLNDCASEEEAVQDMQGRHAAKKQAESHALDTRPRTRPGSGTRRDTTVNEITYVVRELTAEEETAGKHKKLNVNSFRMEHKAPGSRIIVADMSAPDLFSWLVSVIEQQEGIDSPQVDERFLKVTYPVKREVEEPDFQDDDEEVKELNADQATEQIKSPPQVCMVSAEVLKQDGSDTRHVIELCNAGGTPMIFQAHVKSVAEFMQKPRGDDEESKAAAAE